MALTGLDPSATRSLADSMNRAANDIDALAADVVAVLNLSELDSTAPVELTTESMELEKVGLVLHARADVVEGFTIDVESLAKQLDIPKDQVEVAIDAIAGADFDSTADPLLTLVADRHYLFDDAPTSLRETFLGLPAEGENAELDAAVDRLDKKFMDAILAGKPVELDDLSEQQQLDLQVLAAALGGDKIEVLVQRRKFVHKGQGDSEWETVTERVPIIEAGIDKIAGYVQSRLQTDAGRRRSTNELVRATEGIDRNNLAEAAAELGVTDEELGVTLAATDLMVAANEGNIPDVDPSAVTDPSFPDRGDFPDGEHGDRDYVNAVEQNRLDAHNRGENVVGPVGSEQDTFYEAMGSLFGSQNFAFSHDYQATQAEIQNRNDPGVLGVDIPNAITATMGDAAAVVTAPAVAAINSVFGTNIDVGVVGVAIADIGWSAFGYDVDAPTIAESQAKTEFDDLTEEEKQQARDDFDNDSDRRDNLGREGHDPSIRDDDFSGDQNTGGNGLL